VKVLDFGVLQRSLQLDGTKSCVRGRRTADFKDDGALPRVLPSSGVILNSHVT